jgi:hypothetical protein
MAAALRGGAKTTAARGRGSWWMQGGGAARDIMTTSRGEQEVNRRWSCQHDMRRQLLRGGSMDKRMGVRGAVSRCNTATSWCEQRWGVENGQVGR